MTKSYDSNDAYDRTALESYGRMLRRYGGAIDDKCAHCNGTGKVLDMVERNFAFYYVPRYCDACGGSGRLVLVK